MVRPERKKRSLLAAIVLLVSPFALVFLLTKSVMNAGLDYSASGSVFRFRDGVWEPTSKLPGGPIALKVSPAGSVWLSTAFHAGLSRLDGASWTHYKGADFGTATNWVRGGFALRGEEVWGSTEEGVVRFDGHDWRLYKDALKATKPADTVAGPSGVWVLDEDGNLSHFDGTRWSIQSLKGALPGVRWGSRASMATPRLALTGAGALWILWDGLWRGDGGAWREIRPDGVALVGAELIGEDVDGVWLSYGHEIKAVAASGKITARYTLEELGVPAKAGISRLTASGTRLWLATGIGLLSFDGGRWQQLGVPPGTTAVSDAAVAPDGTVWVVGERPRISSPALRLLRPLGIALVMLFLLSFFVSRWMRGKAKDRMEADELVAKATGSVPGSGPRAIPDWAEFEKRTRGFAWKLPLLLLCLPVVVMAGIWFAQWFLKRYWPDAPAWMLLPCAVVPVALIGMAMRAARRKPAGPDSQPQEAVSYKRKLWRAIRPLVTFLVIFILLDKDHLILDPIFRAFRDPSVAVLVIMAAMVVGLLLIFSGRDLVAFFLMRGPLRASMIPLYEDWAGSHSGSLLI